jgi:NADH-quinone oxidoreductase subunit M
MLGTYFTFPELLIWLPLLAGLISFFIHKEGLAKNWALFASIGTLCISIISLMYTDGTDKSFAANNVSYIWLQSLGSSFHVGLDGLGSILTLLNAVSFPLIFIISYKRKYKNANIFYGLMLLTQAGLMGVFCAMDVLLFYFFWELALVPVYFLCSNWGSDKRIQATFKFFVYTFAGSLIMLAGIIYVYLLTPALIDKAGNIIAAHSFSMDSFLQLSLTGVQQSWLFWMFFIAFAIKMPIFPFHTWQPDIYEQAPLAVTMVLSGIMVKMGLFAVLRWLLPLFPLAIAKWDNLVIGLSIFGMIYASLIAIKQDSIKRLVAYSSIAHLGLMCAAVFTRNQTGLQGVMIQMFSHGINIIGLWMVVDLIEQQTGLKKISELGGIAHKAPVLTVLLLIIALANIALPLTNAFVGEFMMFSGLFAFNKWIAAFAGTGIILAAVYTLNMIQKIFYGQPNAGTENIRDISFYQKIVLIVIVVMIFMMGVFPQPMFDLTKKALDFLMIRLK